MSGRQSQFRRGFGRAFVGATTGGMILPFISTLVVARLGFAGKNQRHAALRAVAGFGANHFRVHRARVGFFGAARRTRFLKTRGHVEVEAGCGPDNYGQ